MPIWGKGSREARPGEGAEADASQTSKRTGKGRAKPEIDRAQLRMVGLLEEALQLFALYRLESVEVGGLRLFPYSSDTLLIWREGRDQFYVTPTQGKEEPSWLNNLLANRNSLFYELAGFLAENPRAIEDALVRKRKRIEEIRTKLTPPQEMGL